MSDDDAKLVTSLLEVIGTRLDRAQENLRWWSDEIVLLTRACETLQRLEARQRAVPETPTRTSDQARTISASDDLDLDHLKGTLGDNFVITIREHTERAPARRRRAGALDPKGSTARVVQILDSLTEPATVDDLVDQFTARRWIDPTWSRPEDAIAQAARRAVGHGLIQQLPDKRFTVAMRQQDSQEPSGQVLDLAALERSALNSRSD